MYTHQGFYPYHIKLVHPEEKIIFWREVELMTFTMVMDDFKHEDLYPVAYTLLPDRMEMIAYFPIYLDIEELASSLKSIVSNYDHFFGACSKNRSLLIETRWSVRQIISKEEMDSKVRMINQLPVDLRLAGEQGEWAHSFIHMELFDDGSANPTPPFDRSLWEEIHNSLNSGIKLGFPDPGHHNTDGEQPPLLN